MKKVYIGRVVSVASTVISLALAILPAAANMDWRSTAGVIAGIVAVLTITQKWLTGLQAHEQRLGTVPPIVTYGASKTSTSSATGQVSTGPAYYPSWATGGKPVTVPPDLDDGAAHEADDGMPDEDPS